MTSIISIYFLIFLPLIAAPCCLILPNKKSLPFWFTLCCCALLALLSLYVSFVQPVSNDFNLSLVSLALEFRIGTLSSYFLIALIFAKIIILFLSRSCCEKLFSTVFLLNVFSMVGVLTTNNLFNLFFFLEIYALTALGIAAVRGDKNIFVDFGLNSAASLLLLFAFLIFYLSSGRFSIDFEAFSTPLLFCVFVAWLIKFFPIWSFLKREKKPVFAESMLVQAMLGIFLLMRCNLVSPAFVMVGVLLVVIASLFLPRQKDTRFICIALLVMSLGFALLSVGLQSAEAFRASFFYLLNFVLVAVLLLTVSPRFASPFFTLIPFTPLFFATWYMISASLDSYALVAVCIASIAQTELFRTSPTMMT
ncbi:MAG: hypothetical protein FJX34_01575 [Alphaproteobacteria bacterium]|nr:hypothetical protein [Alphaproteobacteria bacterium]